MTTLDSTNPLAYLGITGPNQPSQVFKTNVAPKPSDYQNFNLGDIWIDEFQNSAYILVNKALNIATWQSMYGQFDFYESVLSSTTEALAVKTKGNRYLASATGGGWTLNNIYERGVTAWIETIPSAGSIVFNEATGIYLLFDGTNWAALSSSMALGSLSDVALVGLVDNDVLTYDLGNTKWVNTKLINSNFDAAAGIEFSKLESLTAAKILVGDVGNVATQVFISGDVGLDATGLAAVTGITLGSDAHGDVYFKGAANLERLPAGTSGDMLTSGGIAADVSWSTPGGTLQNTVICNGGANNYTLDFGAALGALTISIPQLMANSNFIFDTSNNTFTGVNTFSANSFGIGDNGGVFSLLFKVNEVMTSTRFLSFLPNDADRTFNLGGDLILANNFTTAGNFPLTLNQSAPTNITLPSTGTLSTLTGNEILTTKSIDADLNTITNINADEMNPVIAPIVGNASDTVYGIEFTLYAFVSNQPAAVNIYNGNAPFKFEIIDAWSIDTTGAAGSWKLNNGAGGGGIDITDVVSLAGVVNDIDRPTSIVTTFSTITSAGSLSIVPSGGGTENFRLYIKCIRTN